MAPKPWCWGFTGEAWAYIWLCLDSHNLGDPRGIAWLEGRDIAGLAQSLDGIYVPPYLLCWGLNKVINGLWGDRGHHLHQGLASSLRWGSLVEDDWNRYMRRWIVGSQRENVQAFISPLHDRVVWPFRMLLCASPGGSGGFLMRLRDACTSVWCWRATNLYPRWVRPSPSPVTWARRCILPHPHPPFRRTCSVHPCGVGTVCFPSILCSCCGR